MLTHDEDPIIALCTPQGAGALALLRVSGSGVRQLIDSFTRLASKKKVTEVPSHTVHFGWVLDDAGNHIDQVMIIVMDGPRTFTGEDVIELTCHNNRFLIEALIEQALKHGARLAQEGEFSKRAYLHGKVDLIQAEAINELIGASTQQALKASLAQLEGSFSQQISTLEQDLIRTLAWCDASFEFLDEEEEFGERIKAELQTILTTLTSIKSRFAIQQQLRQGIKIALIGSVNAGKSSLFNALLQQKRAIVTDIAGTTRDVIEAGLSYKGNQWTLVDTAGLRSTQDCIEQEGIKRSYEEAHAADIIILVIDGSRPLTQQELALYTDLKERYPRKSLIVQNKADLPLHPQRFEALPLSTLTRLHLDTLYEQIEAKSAELYATMESPFLLNQRHYSLIITLEDKLKAILPLLSGAIAYELVSYHLHDALTILSELTGKSISEAALDRVFKEFCVGK